MRTLFIHALVTLLLVPALASAHGPSRQRVDMQAEFNASPDQVWAAIQDFCSIKDWHPNVTDCSADGGNEPDTVRTITLDNGEQMQERIARFDAERMNIAYMLIEPNTDALPVSTFGSNMTVTASDNGGSVLQWRGAFYRGHTQNDPPPELSDQAAVEAVTTFMDAGIENLKTMVE